MTEKIKEIAATLRQMSPEEAAQYTGRLMNFYRENPRHFFADFFSGDLEISQLHVQKISELLVKNCGTMPTIKLPNNGAIITKMSDIRRKWEMSVISDQEYVNATFWAIASEYDLKPADYISQPPCALVKKEVAK